MGEAVIVSAARTPIADAYEGALANTSIYDIGKASVSEALARSGVPAEEVDDLILGEVLQGGGCIARYLANDLGLPPDTPGLAVNRQCATGMSAVTTAAASIRAGMDRVVIAGGVESMTQAPVTYRKSPVPYGVPEQWLSPSHPDRPEAPNMNMMITVGENTARKVGVSREEQDEWSYGSHRKAIAAIDGGRFAEEIVPMEVRGWGGETRIFDTDEHPRRDTTLEKLASLRVLSGVPDGTITAGNSSSLNDGSAALVLADGDYARANGLEVLGVVRAWCAVGVPPEDTGLAPTIAIPRAVARAGLSMDDLALVEINEAFASMTVGTIKVLDLDPSIVNVNGGAVGLGHPVACSGARILVTLLHELRRRGGGYGVASLCAGGGMGAAAVIEVR
ncbi:thiolase family protein [Rhabdothermincola sediminis]|uniref:thiolase family protein n=1 Tax=Rhabdothermincola sediminis TaxID=2751370 RepID=UPI001AA03147|nr:thiolase family protein [Rhabdothermincola sediminis]